MANRIVEDVRAGAKAGSTRIYAKLLCDGSVYVHPQSFAVKHHPIYVAKIVLAGRIETKNWIQVRGPDYQRAKEEAQQQWAEAGWPSKGGNSRS